MIESSLSTFAQFKYDLMKEEKTTDWNAWKHPEESLTLTGYRSLHELLEDQGTNILFAGVGNVLRKDDGVGVFIAKQITGGNKISSLVVEMGIENYIGKINSLSPDILVIVDACDFKELPGFGKLVLAEEMMELTTNTHNISLAKLSELFNMPVYILGIQPADISFGEDMCREVIETGWKFIKMINTASILSKNI